MHQHQDEGGSPRGSVQVPVKATSQAAHQFGAGGVEDKAGPEEARVPQPQVPREDDRPDTQGIEGEGGRHED